MCECISWLCSYFPPMILREESIFIPLPTPKVVDAVVLIQRWYRGVLKRTELTQSFHSFLRRTRELVRRVVIIQSAFRRYIATRKRVSTPKVPRAPPPSLAGSPRIPERDCAAATIQSWWRLHKTQSVAMKDFSPRDDLNLSRGC
jgi:hypothetical protein